MEVVYRKMQGPYGKSRRYVISLPKEFAEPLLKEGYDTLLVVRIDRTLLLVPVRGFEIDDVLHRVKENYLHLIEVEKAIIDGNSGLMMLEDAVKKLESIVSNLEYKLKEIKLEIKITSPIKHFEKEFEGVKEPEEELPSYLKDNPWLDILLRRGQETAIV
ncbi:MAG: hypothetical protein DRN15_01280 [Thermoprotei archaeon]|nr:MAG: hypothetical protein DRN15_01280 [Thermoprotei archaeon]RLF25795.1 MAG: hypothetical protein DRM97_00535 [Thermoprotei archaeon]